VLAIDPDNSTAREQLSKSCEHQASASEQLLDINGLSGYDFEPLVLRLLNEMGLQVHSVHHHLFADSLEAFGQFRLKQYTLNNITS